MLIVEYNGSIKQEFMGFEYKIEKIEIKVINIIIYK